MLIGVGERVAVLAPDRARAAARAAAGPLQGAPAGRDAHEPGPGALQGQRAGFDLGFVRREGDVLLAAVIRLVVGVVRGGGRERAARGARDGALVGLERVRERVRAVHARDELSGVALRLPGEEHAPGVRVLERPRRRRRRHGASTARDSFGEIRGSEPRGARDEARRGRRGGVGREGEARSRRRGRASVRSVGATRPRVWDARARRGVFPSARASSNGRLTNHSSRNSRIASSARPSAVSRRGGSVHVSFSSVRILPRTKFCRSRAPPRRHRGGRGRRCGRRFASGAPTTHAAARHARAPGVHAGFPSDGPLIRRRALERFDFQGPRSGRPTRSFSGR